MLKYSSVKITRSYRRTISLKVNADGSLEIKAPLFYSDSQIQGFIVSKEKWINKRIERYNSLKDVKPFNADEIKQMKENLSLILPQKLGYFAKIIGVSYKKVTVRKMKTVWGSCSSNGNLSFNLLLSCLPENLIDYVVVHELCHRKQMNHSAKFWTLVGSILPDYKILRKQLKSSTLLYRIN